MSVKGQVVIPQEIRKRLKLRPGQKFDVDIMSDGSILIIPLPPDPVSALKLPDAEKLEKALFKERKKDYKRDEAVLGELRRR
jgi:AbrB family looped-hinge helix DNA binding protein